MEDRKVKYDEDLRIGGIEGGGTHSLLVIMDGKGKELTRVVGSSTNHWALGMEEAASRINGMIVRGKRECEMLDDYPLDCVGLFLSGCEEEKTNEKLIETLRRDNPNASRDYIIGSDTIGSISTGAANSGVIIIAGTGSNGRILNPDGTSHTCGGWGHLIGDEGSAYWIAHRACKYVFDDMDGMARSPHSISYVWPAMKNYFKVSDRQGILPNFYDHFEKSRIAFFAKDLAIGCQREDPLCKTIFEDAGQQLARHVNALASKAHNDLKLSPGGLRIICVGSVWKSWEFMKNGFTREIAEKNVVEELTLTKLTVPAAYGACYRAADKIHCESFRKTYDSNTESFYHYEYKDEKKNIENYSVCKKISNVA